MVTGSGPFFSQEMLRAFANPDETNGSGPFSILRLRVSQAAACDGTKITTTAEGQKIATVTLPIY